MLCLSHFAQGLHPGFPAEKVENSLSFAFSTFLEERLPETSRIPFPGRVQKSKKSHFFCFFWTLFGGKCRAPMLCLSQNAKKVFPHLFELFHLLLF